MTQKPHVALVDISLPAMSVLELASRMKEIERPIEIVKGKNTIKEDLWMKKKVKGRKKGDIIE